MKELTELTLEEIVGHPEFISIERQFKYRNSLDFPIKGVEEAREEPVQYLVIFESNTRADIPMHWVTCTGVKIASRRYVFHTYLNRQHDKQSGTTR